MIKIGEFHSGVWILLLMMYFFILFVIVSQVVSATTFYEVQNTGIRFNDPGFNDENASLTNSTGGSSADDVSISNIRATLSIITGIGAGDVSIGFPAAFIFIFSFLFFWLEFVMLLWAIYMALPFIH